MANKKFSQFVDGNECRVGDQTVGLRGGVNTRFDFPGSGVQDVTGNPLFYWTTAGVAAVNYVSVTSALTTASPTISSAGSDTNPNLTLTTQGAGNLVLDPGSTGIVSVLAAARFGTGLGIQTGQVAGNTVLLQAYDTDGASYTTFGTLTAGATPSLAFGLISATNLNLGFTTTATAAGTTVLTVASTQIQQFTGVTTQTVTMPVTSTLTLGQQFYIINDSSGIVTVQSSGANTIQALAANTSVLLTVILTSGTTAASWQSSYISDGGGSGTVNSGTQNQLAYYAATGTAVSGLATANNGVLVTSVAGVPSISSTLPSGIAATNMALTTPRIGTIADTNGNSALLIAPAASAVNYIELDNAATGAGVRMLAVGGDANINFQHLSKGTGQVIFYSEATTNQFVFGTGTAYTHSSTMNFPATSASRTYTWPDATGTMLITGTAINSVPSITFSSTSGVIGTTTNDSAAAGSVGEVITSTVLIGAGVALSSATDANITSISLTAGDWDVYGNAMISSDGNTLTGAYGWVSTTSATLPDLALVSGVNANALLAFKFGITVPVTRISLNSTTTVYLSCQGQFGAGTVVGCGTIWARRAR